MSEAGNAAGVPNRVKNVESSDFTSNPRPPPSGSRRPANLGRVQAVLISLLLFVAVVLVFLPATRNEFINYDDDFYVTDNVHVQRGLTWESVRWAARSSETGNWHPLTWLSHMLDSELFGLKPWGHHLTNVLLHACNTVLLFLVFRRMTGAAWPSLFVAALFGLHPLHVESVAWVAERKDVLSTLFGLLAIGAYAAYAEKSQVASLKSPVLKKSQVGGQSGVRRQGPEASIEHPASRIQHPASSIQNHAPRSTLHAPRPPPSSILHPPSSSFYYALALLFFALGLMSKPMLVTLPFVLLLLDYWPLQRLRLRENAPTDELKVQGSEWNPAGGVAGTLQDRFEFKIKNLKLKILLPLLLEKLPFLILAAASSVVTFLVQQRAGAMAAMAHLPWLDRVENALVSYGRYLGKLLYPAQLAVFYPHPGRWPTATVVLTVLLLAGFSLLVFVTRRPRPYLLVGWLWFLGTLVPGIGLVQVGAQAIADRYSYVPSIGVFLILAWGAHELTRRWRCQSVVLSVAVALVLVLCTVVTRRQLGYWQNSGTLFAHALAVTQNNSVAHLHAGNYALSEPGRLPEAIGHFEAAVALDPTLAAAHSQLGTALFLQGRHEEGVSQLEQAIRLNPAYAPAHFNLGVALEGQRRLDEAIGQFQEALKWKPEYAEAQNGLGIAFEAKGQVQEGIRWFEAALRLKPDYAAAHFNLGVALVRTGRRSEAIRHFTEALRLQPNYPQAQQELRALTGP